MKFFFKKLSSALCSALMVFSTTGLLGIGVGSGLALTISSKAEARKASARGIAKPKAGFNRRRAQGIASRKRQTKNNEKKAEEIIKKVRESRN